MVPIATERLVVRPFTTGDLDDFLGYQSHPDVRRHLRGDPLAPEEAAAYLEAQSVLDDEQRDAWHDWAIEHRRTGRVIGNVGVYLPANARDEGDLGFQLDPRWHGQGFAREAASALLDRLATTWSLTRVTASCGAANERSARLLLALGMTETRGSGVARSFELAGPGGPTGRGDGP